MVSATTPIAFSLPIQFGVQHIHIESKLASVSRCRVRIRGCNSKRILMRRYNRVRSRTRIIILQMHDRMTATIATTETTTTTTNATSTPTPPVPPLVSPFQLSKPLRTTTFANAAATTCVAQPRSLMLHTAMCIGSIARHAQPIMPPSPQPTIRMPTSTTTIATTTAYISALTNNANTCSLMITMTTYMRPYRMRVWHIMRMLM